MDTTNADAEQNPFLDPDLPEIESETVNHGFIPEGVAFWRRWRHPKPKTVRP